jgi:predicted Rossmann-fold nucleotide-binding protein
MPAAHVVTSTEGFAAGWPDLRDTTFITLDLREITRDWSDALVGRTMFLGCRLPPGVTDALVERGAAVLSDIDHLPFARYRGDLYTYDELFAVDDAIGDWFKQSATTMHDQMVRALHDATVDAAVARFVDGRRMVGVMGAHDLSRSDESYQSRGALGRALTRAGYCVATGGGPGVMEAANLGAWLAPAADSVLAEALEVLCAAPSYAADPEVYRERAREVRERWPNGGESLAVPTWVYLDEPTSAFATHIAKYFTNSVREDGLLAIARSGIVYAAGGAGTTQELFTDIAQNSLTLFEVRSPVVLFGAEHWTHTRPELLRAVRRQADEFGWADLVAVVDDPDAAVAFVRRHDPDASGHAGVEPRRRHGDVPAR